VEALPSKISDYFASISQGLGEKLGQLIYAFTLVITGLFLALFTSPILALACLSYIPVMVVVNGFFAKLSKNAQGSKMQALGVLGGVTEELLGAIKLIVSFAQEEETVKIYDKVAEETMKASKRAVFISSGMGGFIMASGLSFFIYCLTIASVFMQFD